MPAKFEVAFDLTMGNEGGYLSVVRAAEVHDKGGETYRGIARNYHPDWPGWVRIDAAKGNPGFPSSLAQDAELQEMVQSFYLVVFWSYGQFNSQEIANRVFDMAVNMGPRTAHIYLQKALNYVSKAGLIADGLLGIKTREAINAADETNLLNELKARHLAHYIKRALGDASQVGFLVDTEGNPQGWLRRAVS